MTVLGGCATTFLLPGREVELSGPPLLPSKIYPVEQKEVRVINASGESLVGWTFSEPHDKGTVLIAGGNRMSLTEVVHYNSFLFRNGFRVLVYSYQGHDQSGGSRNIRSLLSDAMTFYNYATTAFPEEPVLLAGESISGVTSLCLASQLSNPPAIMVEGIIDLNTVGYANARKFWPLFFIGFPIAFLIDIDVPESLDVMRCARALSSSPAPKPILFVHSTHDVLAPYSDMKKVYDQYTGPKQLLVPHCNPGAKCHMTLYLDSEARREVVKFISSSLYISTSREHIRHDA